MAQQVPRAVQEKIKKLSQHVKLTLEYLKQFSTTQMPYYNFYYEFKHTANLWARMQDADDTVVLRCAV